MRAILRLLPLPALLLAASTARAQGTPDLPPMRAPHPFTDSAWATAPLSLGGVHRCDRSCLTQAPEIPEGCQLTSADQPPGALRPAPMPTAGDTAGTPPVPMPTARGGTDPAPVPMPGARGSRGRAYAPLCPGARAYVY